MKLIFVLFCVTWFAVSAFDFDNDIYINNNKINNENLIKNNVYSKYNTDESDSLNQRVVENFIFGGDEAKNGQFSYAVGIIVHFADGGNGWCGGSLISNLYVLTAAHCLDGKPSAIVILGGNNITNQQESGQIRIFTESFVIHPKWNNQTMENDIALIQLPNKITFSNNIQPLRLPNRRQVGQSFANHLATIIGWGKISNSATSISSVLRFKLSTVITNLSCRLSLPTITIRTSMICTSTNDNGASPCSGDNGSPVTISESDEIPTQIGLVSFGSILGCESNRPYVHTRITDYLDFIADNSNVIIRSGWF